MPNSAPTYNARLAAHCHRPSLAARSSGTSVASHTTLSPPSVPPALALTALDNSQNTCCVAVRPTQNMWRRLSLLLAAVLMLAPRPSSGTGSQEVLRPQELRDAEEWLRGTRPGFCKRTDLAGDCRHDDHGRWALDPRQVVSWHQAAATCRQLCASCERCRHISVSRRHYDCSWAWSCPTTHRLWGVRSAPYNASVPRPPPAAVPTTHRYAGDHMLDAQRAFSDWHDRVRGLRPQVILPVWQRTLALPAASLETATASMFPYGSEPAVAHFNPSALVPAPHGLCEACEHVVAVRVDPWHQCSSRTSPYRQKQRQPINWRGTAIAVLDAELAVLGWTWLLDRPNAQVADVGDDRVSAQLRVARGAHGAFPPPLHPGRSSDADVKRFSFHAYDTRLFTAGGQILATLTCQACSKKVIFGHVQIAIAGTHRDPAVGLRAWLTRKFVSKTAWAAGRNQAVFTAADGRLMLQPWLGLVGDLGRPQVEAPKAVVCEKGRGGSGRGAPSCGPMPDGSRLLLQRVNVATSALRLAANHSRWVTDALCHIAPFHSSPTAHLLPLRNIAGDVTRLLGVAHVHRGRGTVGIGPHDPRGTRSWTGPHAPFQFGYDYTHFFYTIDASPPHRCV